MNSVSQLAAASPALLAAARLELRTRRDRAKYRAAQILRALSRLLSACTGGEGDCTFSAWSEELRRRGEAAGDAALLRRGERRVRFVDGLWFNGPGHCAKAWAWHKERGLLELDDASV